MERQIISRLRGTAAGGTSTAPGVAHSAAVIVPFPAPPAATVRDRLVATWLPTVCAWCRRLGGPRVDPDDAAHDVMLVLLSRHDQIKDVAATRAFIFGVTRRTLAAHRRRAWVRRWAGALGFDPPDESSGAHAAVEQNDRARRLAGALDGLGEVHREVIVLVDIEERNLQDAAELLGVPVGTVKSRLNRARAALEPLARAAGLEGT